MDMLEEHHSVVPVRILHMDADELPLTPEAIKKS